MARLLITIWLSTIVCSMTAFAETIHATSQIDAVTVFPDRATVTRVATVQLPVGTHAIRIGDLPSTLDPASIVANGEGTARVVLVGARISTAYLELPQQPRIAELEGQLQQLNRQERRLHDTRAILNAERAYLDSIKASGLERTAVTHQKNVNDMREMFAFLNEAYPANSQLVQENEDALEDLRARQDALQRALRQLGHGRRAAMSIVVDVDVERAGSFELTTSYQLAGVSWTPVYEARATIGEASVQINTSALIQQRTGEDWSDVLLTLSTARPALGGRMPELQPWYLREWVARPAQRLRGAYDARKMHMAGGIAAEAPAAAYDDEVDATMRREDAIVAQAMMQTNGPAVTYVLTRRETITSDGEPHKVPVTQGALPARYAYAATPKLSEYAYLRAEVTNASDAFLLPGAVQVFLDGAFVATSSIDGIAPTETFDLYLGVDERITVQRQQVQETVAVSLLPGLRGKTKTTEYAYMTTIENHTGTHAQVVLFDQVPVSQHEQITIEAVRWSPQPQEDDAEKPGVHAWHITLASGAKVTVQLSFTVRHPVGLNIAGL